MHRSTLFVSFLALALALPFRATAAESHYDVILRGGELHDGTGGQSRVADLALTGDRITAIGDLRTATAKTSIDARGLIVAPGFIDGHSHFGDREFLRAELAGVDALVAQGVTTAFINTDGWGLADLAEQRALITKARPAINVAPMIGHKPVRIAVLGMSNRAPNAKELDAMRELVRVAFERDGAFGLSTGLIYAPANFAQTDELIALAHVASKYGGFYHSHIRDEGDITVGFVTAIDELIRIARSAKLTGIVTHIKASGPRVWGKTAEVIRRIAAARAEGLSIWADQYPYEAGATYLASVVLPGWAQADGLAAIRARLADPATRARILPEALAYIEGRGGPSAYLISEFLPDPSIQGRRLDEIARARGVEPVDVAFDLIARSEPRAIIFSMRDDDIVAFMRQPWTMTASDGFGDAHPRGHGTFPRKLKVFALERKIISFERALHSMTGQPAEVLGLADRGFLRVGAFADVVAFDSKKLRDRATYEQPQLLSEGMVHVFVNGRAALADGKFTGERAGRVLTRGNHQPAP